MLLGVQKMSYSEIFIAINIWILLKVNATTNASCVDEENNCLQCLDGTWCLVCDQGFMVGLDYNCQPCRPNCSKCYIHIAQYQCIMCFPGYFLNITTDDCQPCLVQNCKNCSINRTVCQQCLIGYGFYGGGCNICHSRCYSCGGMNLSNCLSCNNQHIIYYTGFATQCQRCNNLCMWCQSGVTLCTDCIDGYGKGAGNTCILCNITNCATCPYNYQICTKCIQGYGKFGTQCVLCKDINCYKCYPNYTKCQVCTIGYGVNLNNYTCQPCQQTDCLQCSADSTKCSKCTSNFHLYNKSCNICLQGYVTVDGAIIVSYCTLCVLRYYSDNTHRCLRCQIGCKKCSNATYCQQCQDVSYFLSVNNTCDSCPLGCITCFEDTNTNVPQCTSCNPYFKINQSTIPLICQQICGDSLTFIRECDNQLDQPYDGCDNQCKIMDNFTCQIQNLTTICSYNGTLQMNAIKFYRDPLLNKVMLVIAVFPPLYVFKVSSSVDLMKVFKINNNSITIQNIIYNSDRSQLTITAHFTVHLIDQPIEIVFEPQQNVKPQYYASFNASQILDFQFYKNPVYFYSQSVLLLLRIIYAMSICVTVLGWISFIFGIVIRRLEGLQAMMVLQFSWVILVWIDPFPGPFALTYPLKFSSGYSHQFISYNQEISTISPHTYQFKLSKLFFVNNFNLNLILLIISAIIPIIFYFKLRKFKTQNPHIDFQDKDSIIVHAYQTLNKKYQFCYQLFMYVFMFNLIYYITCSELFFKYGDRQNIPSLIIFSLSTITILSMLIKYYFDPILFGQFRFSFHRKFVAINHYLIHIFFTILTVTLIITLSEYAWAPAAPCVLMLLFTLIYKPYIETKQNYRSAFNIFVMCCFIGIRIYAHQIPKTVEFSNGTYIFLLLNISLMLLTVMIISFLFQGYYLYTKLNAVEQQPETIEYKKRQFKVIKQLCANNTRLKMMKMQDNLIFKNIISPNTSIMKFSNMPKEIKNNQNKYMETQENFATHFTKQQDNQQRYLQHQTQISNDMKNQRKQMNITQKNRGNLSNQEMKWYVNNLNDTQEIIDEQGKVVDEEIIAKRILASQNNFINYKAAQSFVQSRIKKKSNLWRRESYIAQYNFI